jgi:hypothetical protein
MAVPPPIYPLLRLCGLLAPKNGLLSVQRPKERPLDAAEVPVVSARSIRSDHFSLIVFTDSAPRSIGTRLILLSQLSVLRRRKRKGQVILTRDRISATAGDPEPPVVPGSILCLSLTPFIHSRANHLQCCNFWWSNRSRDSRRDLERCDRVGVADRQRLEREPRIGRWRNISRRHSIGYKLL